MVDITSSEFHASPAQRRFAARLATVQAAADILAGIASGRWGSPDDAGECMADTADRIAGEHGGTPAERLAELVAEIDRQWHVADAAVGCEISSCAYCSGCASTHLGDLEIRESDRGWSARECDECGHTLGCIRGLTADCRHYSHGSY